MFLCSVGIGTIVLAIILVGTKNVPADMRNVPADTRNIRADMRNVPVGMRNVPADMKNVLADTKTEMGMAGKPIKLQVILSVFCVFFRLEKKLQSF